MIYTIGDTKVYLEWIERKKSQGNVLYKTGRLEPGQDPDYPDGYPGGSVFETYDDALRCCASAGEEFSVFGVLAEWNKDTIQTEDGWWHDLLVDSEIVILE